MMSVPPPAIVCEGLTVGMRDDCVRDITLSIARASISVVGGDTGSGKTALMRTLGGVLPPRAGTLRIWGENPYALPANVLPFWRRRVALCVDDLPLIADASVRDNVLVAVHAAERVPDDESLSTLTQRIERLGVTPDTPCGQLSRGQAAAVRVLRTMAGQAEVLLLDDPVAVCDPDLKTTVYRWLFDAACAGACVVVAASGPVDPGLGAAALLCLREGRLVPADALRKVAADA